MSTRRYTVAKGARLNKPLVLTVAAVLIIGAGCKSKSDDIFPMTVGSTWKMDGYTLMGTTLAAMDTVQTSTIDTKVEKEAELTSGDKVYEFIATSVVHMFDPETTFTSSGTSYIREAGGAILSYESLSDPTPDTVLYTDLSVGKKWDSGDSSYVEVIAQENVTVKAGSYTNAWKLRSTTIDGADTMHVDMWLAPGVGQVKMHYEMVPMTGYLMISHTELVEVDVK
jgi:hypothetical protein